MTTEREAWLHENVLAKGLVKDGLRQAKNGQFSDEPPDLNADVELTIPKGMIPDTDLRAQLIEVGLRLIAQKCGEESDWPEKYGTGFENHVFLMHTFCWCEDEDCKYCCDNPSPNFLHKESGLEVRWYKYIGRSMKIDGNMKAEEILKMIQSCLESIEGD